nr:origin of replication complex subunit 1A-like [Ipomoea batatas]
MGLWSPLKNQIIYEVGSVQRIPEIPDELKLIYKTVWEIKQRTLVDMAADHGCYIDQSQSLNIHTDGPTQFWKAYFHGCDYNMKDSKNVGSKLEFSVYDVNHGDQPRSLPDVKEIKKDDVFLCEYEYDIHWHSFKHIVDIDDGEEDCEEAESAREWNSAEAFGSDSEDDVEYEEENNHNLLNRRQLPTHPLAVNSRKGQIFELQKIGAKKIPENVRSHKLTELEKAKATLLLATLPK